MVLKFREFYKPEETVTEKKEKKLPAKEKLVEKEVFEEKKEERSFAVFAVGIEWYAIDLGLVSEIVTSFEILSVPHLPQSFAGVINLRGESVPVVDLRKLLKIEAREEVAWVCIITTIGSSKIGLMVDSDVEIVNLEDGRFYALPDCYTKDEAEFLDGIFLIQDRFAGILRPARVIEILTEWRQDENL
jgi:purine-binding chemotaxis protein CheW